ncbi:uncharacterized protein BYT42DRAFT_546292 [Radiomyces spectabilis]|uniref:uncharacterized protein n=1 Tax=Radiomyces spectabilis TaxID=64574 RepID=UPI00221F4DF6|nr:uncharacterized protein BYT42DRAFT_546292 [Radiomyces spectabilis]KAI8377633.1 hypothetical protein BYT42DRAFT_546292 [Radiomyces spectabilis]
MEEPAVQSFDPSLSISKAEIPPTSIVSASPLPVIEKETKPEIPVNVARMDQESIASDHVVEPSVEPAADRLSEVDRESLAAHDDPTSPVHTSDSSQITYQEEQDDEENDKMTQQQSDDKTAASSIQSSPLLEFDRRRSTTSDDQFQPLKTRLRPATQTEPISDTPLNRHVTLKPSVSVRLQTRIKKSGRRLTKLFKK